MRQKVFGHWAEFWVQRHLIPSWVLRRRGSCRDSTARPWKLEMQSLPLEARVTPVELLIYSALSPLIALEKAQWERSVLLLGDKRLLREGSDVDSLCNQKGKFEILKLILIRLKCMCILLGPSKRCTWILMCLVCPIPNAYAGIQSCIMVMMWWWCGRPATSYTNDVLGSPPQTWLNGLASSHL